MQETASATPKVTALIVSYNCASVLRRCLTALEASQERDKIEIIVVDNGSIDESPRLDAEFPGVTFMRLPRNFGATKALNIGMRTAAADYVFFLAPEVLVEPATVLSLSRKLDEDDSAVAVCPVLVDEKGSPVPSLRRLPTLDGMRALRNDPNAIPAELPDLSGDAVAVEYPMRQALCVRKAFIKAFNWLDDRYGDFGGDLELAYQIRRVGKRSLVVTAARAQLTPAIRFAFDTAALATIAADRIQGIATFLGKHAGWFAGLQFKLSSFFWALGGLVTFRQPGFQFRLISALISGQKIDGSQHSL